MTYFAYKGLSFGFLGQVEKGRLRTLYMEQVDMDLKPMSIYLGRLKQRLPGDHAYLVSLGEEGDAYLNGTLLDQGGLGPLTPKLGDMVIVQVQALERQGKLPKVSARYALKGRFMVLEPGQGQVRLSKKIVEARAGDAITKCIAPLLPHGLTCIVRTQALQASANELSTELQTLISQHEEWLRLKQLASKPRVLEKKVFHNQKWLDQWLQNPEPLVTNDHEWWVYLSTIQPDLVTYQKDVWQTLNLDFLVQALLKRRHEAGLGTEIVIDQLEAFTVIDVNSKGFDTSYQDQGTFAFEVNQQVLEVLFQTITMRNIGGIIMVDFLSMPKAKEQHFLKTVLPLAKQHDCYVKGFTQTGLLEMTRPHVGLSLKEVLTKPLEEQDKPPESPSWLLEKVFAQLNARARDEEVFVIEGTDHMVHLFHAHKNDMLKRLDDPQPELVIKTIDALEPHLKIVGVYEANSIKNLSKDVDLKL